MYSLYFNRTTPFLAFLEGMVRMFDWAALLEFRRSKADVEVVTEDDDWSDRIVDWYIRDSINAFEREESWRLEQLPVLQRRAAAVADIVLGPLPIQEVILNYEEIVPGACERIMQQASEKLRQDGEAQIQLLKERARQGYMGMAVGFLVTMVLACAATYLVLSGHLAAGLSLGGIFLALIVAASTHVSRSRLRRKFYTRGFFARSPQHR